MVATADVTIDAERCPTCDEERFIMLRGNRIDCPTCCATRHGETRVLTQRRLPFGRITVMFSVGAAAVMAGMLIMGSRLLW
jgi:hypothetical protein